MSENIITEYQEIDLDRIINYYRKDFVTKEGYEILGFGGDWFLDINKKKVIYKILIEREKDKEE